VINLCVYRLTRLAAKFWFALFFELKLECLEHLLIAGPFVLLPKHQRWEDIPLLSLASPYPLYYVAKHELFMNPLSKWFISALGGIPLNRQMPTESRVSIKNIFSVLEMGEKLVVFPEGTYYKGITGPGHSAMIRMIRSRMNIPFIPVGVNYSHGKRRKVVRIRFGQAMSVESSDDVETFMAEAMRKIAELSNLPLFGRGQNAPQGGHQHVTSGQSVPTDRGIPR
jgi:1-acyl-sn-glycerol-3-phosphate acyltransferase